MIPPVTPILPIVHHNGTSQEALLNGACEIGSALRHVLDALVTHAPNQRDYYPDPDRWQLAIKQQVRRVDTIRALYQELQAEAEGIADDLRALPSDPR